MYLFLEPKRRVSSFEIKKRAAEKKEAETKKEAIIQVDDLLSFRQFSKKMADEAIDVSPILSTSVSLRLIRVG